LGRNGSKEITDLGLQITRLTARPRRYGWGGSKYSDNFERLVNIIVWTMGITAPEESRNTSNRDYCRIPAGFDPQNNVVIRWEYAVGSDFFGGYDLEKDP
jgi:hypothetical protein